MHKVIEKCWICGEAATKTITKGDVAVLDGLWIGRTQEELLADGSFRCYCDKCYKDELKKLADRKRQYAVIKKQLMLERAIRSLERQNVVIYHYRDLIKDFETFVEENPDKFDSSQEMLTMLILADNGISVTPQFKIGRYRVDFLIPTLKVALEIDGDRHALKPYEDSERDKLIRAVLGEEWEVVRISTEYIDANAEKLVEAIKAVRDKKKELRQEYGGILPEWHSKRERAQRPKRKPPIVGDDELLKI